MKKINNKIFLGIIFIGFIIFQIVWILVLNSKDLSANPYLVTTCVKRAAYSGRFSFVFFMWFSFWRFQKEKNAEPTAKTALPELFTCLFIQYLCISAGTLLWIYRYIGLQREYVFFVLQVVLLYVTLPSLLAGLFGAFAARARNYFISCPLLIFAMYAFLGKWFSTLSMYFGFVPEMGVKLRWFLRDIFEIFGPLHNILDDYYYTLSVAAVDFQKIGFWILTAVFLFLQVSEKKNIPVRTAMAMGAVVLLIFYIQPVSRYVVYDNCEYDSWNYDQYYDGLIVRSSNTEKERNFNILSYDMQLTVRRNMSAEVTVYPDTTDLEQYSFILYHGYEVNNVSDADKNALRFERKGNLLTVYRDEGNCSCINFQYKGDSDFYLSNSQCINLSENIAYYPVPGNQERGVGADSYHPVSQFYVYVDTNQQVYCNLEEEERNHFSGMAEGVVLFAGRTLEMTQVGEAKIIYPSIRWTKEEIVEEYNLLCSEMESKGLTLAGKNWFVMPTRTIKKWDIYYSGNYVTGDAQDILANVDALIRRRGE